jgi:YVTN family beta-propeller protein
VYSFGKGFIRGAAWLPLFALSATSLGAQVSPASSVMSDPGAIVVLTGGAEALLIDPVSRQILDRFPTGPDPRGIALSPDGRYAYVTSYGWQPGGHRAGDETETVYGAAAVAAMGPDSRGVTVLDLDQRAVHAVFQPGMYRNLEGIRVGNDGERLWMTAAADSGVVELSAHTGEVHMLWKTGGANASTLTVSRDNRRIYVANTGSDLLTMIDRVTVVPQQVRTGREPVGLALSNNERELWVANRGDHTISVIDTRRLREVASFPSGGQGPTQLAFHPSGHEVWIINRGSRDVTVLDVVSAAVLATIPVDGDPGSIAFSADGKLAFVSDSGRNTVDVIDVVARRVIEVLEAGASTGGMAWMVLSGASRGTGR